MFQRVPTPSSKALYGWSSAGFGISESALSTTLGAIRPNPIASRIKIAVELSPRITEVKLDGALVPRPANCTRPAASLRTAVAGGWRPELYDRYDKHAS